MTNTREHTPAPWSMGEKTVFKDHGFKVYGYPISAGGQAIARVHAGSVGKEAFSFGNQEANARLVTAAPDLLAALERCEDRLGVLIECDNEKGSASPDDVAAWESARAAISKATQSTLKQRGQQ